MNKEMIDQQQEMLTTYRRLIDSANKLPLLKAERFKILEEAGRVARRFKTEMYKQVSAQIDEALDQIQETTETHGNS